jgi:hypothetical protein
MEYLLNREKIIGKWKRAREGVKKLMYYLSILFNKQFQLKKLSGF